MIFTEVNPRKYEAVQFNKIGDVPGVSRGYIQTKGSAETYFISEAVPRSMDCRACFIINTSEKGMQEIKPSDWVLTNVKNGRIKIVPNVKFLKKYVGYHGDTREVQSPETAISPDPSGFLGWTK